MVISLESLSYSKDKEEDSFGEIMHKSPNNFFEYNHGNYKHNCNPKVFLNLLLGT